MVYVNREGQGTTESQYLAVMLGSSLLAQLTDVGLLSESPQASELLDLEVTLEDIAAYLGPDTGMYMGQIRTHAARGAAGTGYVSSLCWAIRGTCAPAVMLMRRKVQQQCERLMRVCVPGV